LGPGVAISSTRKDHETGTGAGSTLQNPLEVRLPLALTLSSQVVQMVEPLFSAAAEPAILKLARLSQLSRFESAKVIRISKGMP